MGRPYSVASLADYWGCGTDKVYALIRSGELRAFKLGERLYRIRPDEVERFECQTNTACNDTGTSWQSSGMKADDDTDIRLERLIERQPKPPRAHSGSAGR